MSSTVIFDLDGTLYFGEESAYYAKEALNELQNAGFETLFFTNNSTKTRKEVYEKLLRLELNVTLDRIYTSSYATALYLQESNIKKIFLIGSSGFKQELQEKNIIIVDETAAEAVVIGLDLTFNYEDIAKAFLALQRGAKLIVCNRDENFPIENGILRPGLNAIVSSLLGCTKKKDVDYLVGKPNSYLLEKMAQEWQLETKNICVVGDSIESDIAMANNYGCKSFLVGTDKMTLKDVTDKLIRKTE